MGFRKKQTDFLGFRISSDTRLAIEREAARRGCKLSEAAREILARGLDPNAPERAIVLLRADLKCLASGLDAQLTRILDGDTKGRATLIDELRREIQLLHDSVRDRASDGQEIREFREAINELRQIIAAQSERLSHHSGLLSGVTSELGGLTEKILEFEFLLQASDIGSSVFRDEVLKESAALQGVLGMGLELQTREFSGYLDRAHEELIARLLHGQMEIQPVLHEQAEALRRNVVKAESLERLILRRGKTISALFEKIDALSEESKKSSQHVQAAAEFSSRVLVELGKIRKASNDTEECLLQRIDQFSRSFAGSVAAIERRDQEDKLAIQRDYRVILNCLRLDMFKMAIAGAIGGLMVLLVQAIKFWISG